MLDTSFQDELLKEVDRLPPAKQRSVLDYARALGNATPEGTPGDQLLKLCGILDPESAKEMMQAIEEGCEQVDPNAW